MRPLLRVPLQACQRAPRATSGGRNRSNLIIAKALKTPVHTPGRPSTIHRIHCMSCQIAPNLHVLSMHPQELKRWSIATGALAS